MKNTFYRTENFNDEVMQKFAEYLDENDLYVIKSRGYHDGPFELPKNPETREKLLEEIVESLNDGFYSNDSCIAYLYALFEKYKEK
ncbi:MAG: hypothetical protein J5815_03285 [Clostridia bacterium]|nr:hypothetical protein [Clostridia bacterium]